MLGMHDHQRLNKLIADAAEDFAKRRESVLLEQLGDLVKDGLLVVETTTPFFIHESLHTNKLKIEQGVRLVLKNKEVYDAMKRERDFYKEKFEQMRELFSSTLGSKP